MRFFGTFRGVLRYVSTFSHYFLVYLKKSSTFAPNYRTNQRQITEQISAKLPNFQISH